LVGRTSGTSPNCDDQVAKCVWRKSLFENAQSAKIIIIIIIIFKYV